MYYSKYFFIKVIFNNKKNCDFVKKRALLNQTNLNARKKAKTVSCLELFILKNKIQKNQ